MDDAASELLWCIFRIRRSVLGALGHRGVVLCDGVANVAWGLVPLRMHSCTAVHMQHSKGFDGGAARRGEDSSVSRVTGPLSMKNGCGGWANATWGIQSRAQARAQ